MFAVFAMLISSVNRRPLSFSNQICVSIFRFLFLKKSGLQMSLPFYVDDEIVIFILYLNKYLKSIFKLKFMGSIF